MTKTDRVRYEMLLRVRDFGTAHGAAFPESSKGGKAFARVSEAVAAIDAHTTAKMIAAQDGRRARTAARGTVRRWMLAIARTARDITLATPELERTLRMPRRGADDALLASARVFLEKGEPLKDELVESGLSSTFLIQFREAVDTFEHELANRRSGRRRVSGGQRGIKTALSDGMIAARTLDVVVTNVVGDDPVLLASWQRDRRLIEGRARRVLTVVTPPVVPDVGIPADVPASGESGSIIASAEPETPTLALVTVEKSDEPLDKAS